MPADGPIGVFDSGVGGLSVLREVRRELPDEPVVYVADSRFAPYGERDAGFIAARADTIVGFLVGRGAKAVVVACNTATGIAVESLRLRFHLPIVAIEPAIKPAAAHTRSGVVGVLATRATLSSARFAQLLNRHSSSVRVAVQPCPGLVERVELGDFDGPVARQLVEQYVHPLTRQGADTLVIGCTHYSFLLPLIREVAGTDVTVIDPAAAVARELRRRLAAVDLLRAPERVAVDTFWSSGDVARVTCLLQRLWSSDAVAHELPPEFCEEPSQTSESNSVG